jgi:hypothetical protein
VAGILGRGHRRPLRAPKRTKPSSQTED